MAPYVDFAAVKAAVTFEQAIELLGLKMKKQGKTYRSACPSCQKGDDRSLAVTPGEGFYCHAQRKGGDVIAFVAHVRGCSQREAGGELQERFLSERPKQRPAPQERESDELQPLDHLTTDHPAIEALGLTSEVCDALGIGYASKGMMRGRVAFPLRLPDGTLVGYAGLATSGDQAPLMLLPSNLDQRIATPPKQEIADDKVVDFKKFFRNAS